MSMLRDCILLTIQDLFKRIELCERQTQVYIYIYKIHETYSHEEVRKHFRVYAALLVSI